MFSHCEVKGVSHAPIQPHVPRENTVKVMTNHMKCIVNLEQNLKVAQTVVSQLLMSDNQFLETEEYGS